MLTEKPEGIKSRPQRRRTKDNPYDIYVAKRKNEDAGYFVYFCTGVRKGQWMNINEALYALLDQFEKDNLCYMNE